MPAPGDQHNNAPANPFEEAKPRISEYTARELAVLQGRLQQQLGPEFISTRKGPGGKNVHYIASDKVIGLANDVFGFNGWSSAIRDIQVDFVDENTQTKRVDVGLSVIVRVTLRDGTYHEDIGYGHIENCSGKAAAFEKAKKEGTTDALKRALRNFGNVLGNCVYDKDYLAKVTKIKVRPARFAEENLHRHADFALPTSEGGREGDVNQNTTTSIPANQSADRSDTATIKVDEAEDFTSVDFDDADFSFSELDQHDAMVLEPRQSAEFQRSNATPHNTSRPSAPSFGGRPQAVPPSRHPLPPAHLRQHPNPHHVPNPHLPPNQPSGPRPHGVGNVSRPVNPRMASAPVPVSNGPRPGPPNSHQQKPTPSVTPQTNTHDSRANMASNASNGQAPAILPGEMPVPANAPTGFVPGRNAEHAQKADGVVPAFNPHTESPSIRRTAGFDHTKTSSVKRTAVPWTSPAGNAPQVPAGAQSDMVARRVGAPVQHNSPLSNRAQFKPVGKRPAETDPVHSLAHNGQSNTSQSLRQALSDVTSGAVNISGAHNEGPPEAKKQRLETETIQGKETLAK